MEHFFGFKIGFKNWIQKFDECSAWADWCCQEKQTCKTSIEKHCCKNCKKLFWWLQTPKEDTNKNLRKNRVRVWTRSKKLQTSKKLSRFLLKHIKTCQFVKQRSNPYFSWVVWKLFFVRFVENDVDPKLHQSIHLMDQCLSLKGWPNQFCWCPKI